MSTLSKNETKPVPSIMSTISIVASAVLIMLGVLTLPGLVENARKNILIRQGQTPITDGISGFNFFPLLSFFLVVGAGLGVIFWLRMVKARSVKNTETIEELSLKDLLKEFITDINVRLNNKSFKQISTRQKIKDILDLLAQVNELEEQNYLSLENRILVTAFLEKDLKETVDLSSNKIVLDDKTVDKEIETQLTFIIQTLISVVKESKTNFVNKTKIQTIFLKNKLGSYMPENSNLDLSK